MAQMVKKSGYNERDLGSITELGRSPGEENWQLTPVFLPEEFQGQRSLVDYSPCGRKELDMTKQLSHKQMYIYLYLFTHTHTHTAKICIGV